MFCHYPDGPWPFIAELMEQMGCVELPANMSLKSYKRVILVSSTYYVLLKVKPGFENLDMKKSSNLIWDVVLFKGLFCVFAFKFQHDIS